MNSISIKTVHIGKAISDRLKKLRINKSEFSRRLGVPQQNINRLLEREHIDTKKLVKISEALDFNFFSLYCDGGPKSVSAHMSAVALGDGNASVLLGEQMCVAELEKEKTLNEILTQKIELLQKQIELLDENVASKNKIIELMENK